MKKSDNALKTIGEVAEIVEVPTHVLRFWETKFGNIKPVKYNNRRYYDLKNIEIIATIKKILYEDNLTISEAADLLKKKSFENKANSSNQLQQLTLFESHKYDTEDSLNILTGVRNKLLEAKNKLNVLLQK